MPTSVLDALAQLVGQNVTLGVDGRTLSGVLASVTATLVILATGGGVVYFNPTNVRTITITGTSGTGTTILGGTTGV